MNTKSYTTSVLDYLKRPFEYIAGIQALLLGLLFLAVSIFLGVLFNARFDGLLNLHFVQETNISQLVTEQLINFFSLLILFFLIAKIIGARQARFIDLAGTLLLAMAPLSIMPILNYNELLFTASQGLLEQIQSSQPVESSITAIIVVTSLLMVLAIIYMVSLMFQAYKICTNFKGTKLIVSFMVGILSAAILSKFLIIQIS